MYIQRHIESSVVEAIKHFPVTVVTGPRQCGKSTLAKHLLEKNPDSIYLDLERPSDLRKLDDAERFLTSWKEKLICIDEVQRCPELFPLLRSLVDEWNRPGCFLILGSASRDWLKQSSESLAGRITYKRLTPFLWEELDGSHAIENYFSAGAFPCSLLAEYEDESFEWRENFISTFLERDLFQWKGFASPTMSRLWQLLAHLNGETVNYSAIASSLGITPNTVKSYLDLLAGTYMIEIVPPYLSTLGKRLVKTPKAYIADSGITAALLGLQSFEEVAGHPVFASVWEQIVLTNLKGLYPEAELFYYRTANGAETDIVMKLRNKVFAIECEVSDSPVLSKGNYNAYEDIDPLHTFVVTLSPDDSWEMNPGIDVVSLQELKSQIDAYQ
ncbi:MAG: ATP-binding protein [Tannerellaceae bacterium]|nr:ATP-binding protein [Tannerellaceae bacterium]